MGIIREPLAILLGLLAFGCAAGAAWQSGLAWPAASRRPWARVAAAAAVVLAAFGFSLGYWEVLSGIGEAIWHFDAGTTHFLFDVAAYGLPISVLGLVLAVTAMLHAADVPPRAVIPAVAAGAAILWLLDPYKTLGGSRMDPVRARYAQAQLAAVAPSPRGWSVWNLFDNYDAHHVISQGGSGDSHQSASSGSGGGDGGDGDGNGAIILLVVALAVLAVAGGVITAILVFGAGRKRAQEALERQTRLRTSSEIAWGRAAAIR